MRAASNRSSDWWSARRRTPRGDCGRCIGQWSRTTSTAGPTHNHGSRGTAGSSRRPRGEEWVLDPARGQRDSGCSVAPHRWVTVAVWAQQPVRELVPLGKASRAVACQRCPPSVRREPQCRRTRTPRRFRRAGTPGHRERHPRRDMPALTLARTRPLLVAVGLAARNQGRDKRDHHRGLHRVLPLGGARRGAGALRAGSGSAAAGGRVVSPRSREASMDAARPRMTRRSSPQ